MGKKKVLVLAENINYNRTSSGIRSFNLLNLLSTKYDVTCICYEAFSPEAEWQLPDVKIEVLERKEKLATPWELLDKIWKVRTIPAYVTGLSLWHYRLIQDWNKTVYKHLSNNDVVFIYVLGTGHDFNVHHAVARLKVEVPIMAHIHDPYPFNQYPEPYRQYKFLYSRMASQFKRVIRNVDFVSFPSLYLKDWMSRFYPEIDKKHLIIPHPECIADYSNIACPKSFDKLDDSQFILMHLGSLLKERNPIHLLKAFKRFCQSDPEKKEKAFLYIIGRINNEYVDLIQDKQGAAENIQSINSRVTYPQTKQIMTKATALIILEAISEFSPFMPGKISDYLMADKPIVALTPLKSEVSRLLGGDYSHKTEVNDEDEILRILNDLWQQWKQNKNLKMNRSDLKTYISVEKSLEVFEKIEKTS
ncbi:MAG: hypothetical protein HRT68_07055 [Flavobacteriaceae bacterium]|nr:hypothetical protein [Flavobacteriaceae bacterium]